MQFILVYILFFRYGYHLKPVRTYGSNYDPIKPFFSSPATTKHTWHRHQPVFSRPFPNYETSQDEKYNKVKVFLHLSKSTFCIIVPYQP